MKTLLLDVSDWDLLLDASGNIALASEPYAVAQDVASALRLFAAELWYNVDKGIPYFTDVFGTTPPVAYFQELMIRAAKTVPTVVSAECIIEAFEGRTVNGQVSFVTSNGRQGRVSIQ
jgi:hypothetical protein